MRLPRIVIASFNYITVRGQDGPEQGIRLIGETFHDSEQDDGPPFHTPGTLKYMGMVRR